jgi:hypothetical protein
MDVVERFMRFVDKRPCGCWVWTGAKYPNGYGAFSVRRCTPEGAHRVAYRLFKGDTPKGSFVCHTCDEPACVNPDHLFLGSPKDNTWDMLRKGRGCMPPVLVGENNSYSKLTEAAVRDIRTKRMLQREFAELYGVKQAVISKVQLRKVWAHVV